MLAWPLYASYVRFSTWFFNINLKYKPQGFDACSAREEYKEVLNLHWVFLAFSCENYKSASARKKKACRQEKKLEAFLGFRKKKEKTKLKLN